MLKLGTFAVLIAVNLGCTVMVYEDVAQTEEGLIAVTGTEVRFFGTPTAINVICEHDGENDYVCKKFFPGSFVGLYGDTDMYRDPNTAKKKKESDKKKRKKRRIK